MADDDGMMFNFAVITPTNKQTNKPQKPKNPQNNNNKPPKTATNTAKSEDGKANSENRKKNKRQHQESEEGEVKKKKKKFKTPYIPDDKFTPISSLFNKNPDIPDIEDAPKEEQPTESAELFTSDDIKSLKIHSHLVGNLVNTMKYTKMTNIQRLALPHLLQGKDCLLKSPTGSGKTVCYTLPIVDKLMQMEPRITRADGPYALILVPTRELALQCFEFVQDVCKSCVWVVPGLLIGGDRCKAEKARLRKGVNIIVATPGRLLYHLKETKRLSFHHINFLVLDEGDKLLDMGFEKSILDILNTIKERSLPGETRQSVLCSATLNPRLQAIAGVSLNNHLYIDASKETDAVQKMGKEKKRDEPLGVVDFMDEDEDKNQKKKSKKTEKTEKTETPNSSDDWDEDEYKNNNDGASKNEASEDNATTESDKTETEGDMIAPSTLQQFYCVVPAKLPLVTLLSVIIEKIFLDKSHNKLIVFTLSKQSVEFHYNLLRDIVYPYCVTNMKNTTLGLKDKIFKLHGDMRQKDRFEAFKLFKKSSGSASVLFCTDVAARGLDIPDVNWIVQYNCPAATDDYLHRVGRTARIGAEGKSLLLMLPSEVQYKQVLDKHKVEMESMELNTLLTTLATGKKKTQNEIETAATNLQSVIETKVLGNPATLSAAKHTYLSYIRGYATYPSALKHIFHVKFLHLGHLAKSFGLQEAPKKIHEVNELKRNEKKKDEQHIQKMRLLQKMAGPKEEVYYSDQLLDGPRPNRDKSLAVGITVNSAAAARKKLYKNKGKPNFRPSATKRPNKILLKR